MKVTFEDRYDWESLRLRFVPNEVVPSETVDALKGYLPRYFSEQEVLQPEEFRFTELFGIDSTDDGCVELLLDLPPKDICQRLSTIVEERFPSFVELRVGDPLQYKKLDDSIGWMDVDGEVGGLPASFAISYHLITINQFEQFVTETGYQPLADRLSAEAHGAADDFYQGHTIRSAKGTWGDNASSPMIFVTYDDAIEFCLWSETRLPTACELELFFTCFRERNFKYDWWHPCWTSTAAGDDIFVTHDGSTRKQLHRHHYDWVEAPGFRVVRVDHPV